MWMPRSPSIFLMAGAVAHSAAVFTTSSTPADATMRLYRSTRMKRRRGAWRVSRLSAIRQERSTCRQKNVRSNIRCRSTAGDRPMSDFRMIGMIGGRDRVSETDLAPLLAGYRPLPGIFDEMVDAQGRVRAHWQPLLAMLARLAPQELTRRFAAADRHLHDSGAFYRVYEDASGAERPWPLSHVPLLIDGSEWQTLKAGLIQPAELLDAVLACADGAEHLVREGSLRAAIIAGNPEFLRPLVGVVPAGGAHLHFYAVDIGRSPDGRWWVLRARPQAPSGSGYALENRL